MIPDVGEMRFMAEREWDGLDISLRCIHGTCGSVYVAEPVKVKTIVEGERIDPFMMITDKAAKTLMDELWRIGIRPTEGHGSTGQLAATEKHLSDMRLIAFNRLNITEGKEK